MLLVQGPMTSTTCQVVTTSKVVTSLGVNISFLLRTVLKDDTWPCGVALVTVSFTSY